MQNEITSCGTKFSMTREPAEVGPAARSKCVRSSFMKDQDTMRMYNIARYCRTPTYCSNSMKAERSESHI